MTIGCGPLAAKLLPTMDEWQAAAVLADLTGSYRVPADWIAADDDRILVFTGDPVLAVLVADVLARLELGAGYPCVEGGGVAVDPVEVVLCGVPGSEFLDWRPYQPGDVYALQACVVRPAGRREAVR
jgi:hypothetical protein